MRTLLMTLIILTDICLVSAAPKYYGLSSSEGLSNSSVISIAQDSKGLLWIGTWDGLNVYDSHSFTIYRHDPGDANTISNNVITGIEEQEGGIMWVATNYGINRIDTHTGTISRFYPGYENKAPLEEKTFSVTVVNGTDVFCSAKEWGLAVYDETGGSMTPMYIEGFPTEDICSIYGAGHDRLMVMLSDGTVNILEYHRQEDGRIDFTNRTEPVQGIRATYMSRCSDAIMIATDDNRIFKYSTLIGSVDFSTKTSPGIHVTAMTRIDGSRFAFASYPSGVYICNMNTGEMAMEESLSDVSLHVLYYGSQKILWAGTDGQGLRALYDDSFNMTTVRNSEISNSKNYPVRAFFKDRDGNLFVGTKGNGVTVFRNGEKVRTYTTDNGLSNNSVYAFTEGLNNDILVGHDGEGLNAISLKTGRVTSILPGSNGNFSSTYSFWKDPDNGSLWLGTYRDGLINMKLEYIDGKYCIKEYRQFRNDKDDPSSINSNNVFPILGQDGIIWVGTRGGGLCRYDKSTGRFTNHTASTEDGAISSNEILSLHVSSDSTLWIGTGYGLNRLVTEDGGKYSFESFTSKDGLANNTIMGIEEDANHNLWLSTNKGLSVFNPRTGNFTNYYDNAVLQDNEYADGAYYMDAKGYMYFGGRDGFNSFLPSEIKARTFSPTVLIRRFNVQQNPLPGFDPSKEITLRHDENFFSINYTALEYINNASCEYSYILEGFNEDWISAGTSRSATYTNVPHGNYTFKIRCTNGDKVWSDKVTELRITVRPPWWDTVLAYMVYILLGVGMLISLNFLINARMRRKHRLEIEALRRKQLTDTYEAKLRFFTNIAHEFTTPLTLIYGPLDQIAANYRLPQKVEQYHKTIRSNADRLLKLIEELIEFRRVDTGNQKPEYARIDLRKTITSILDNFSELNSEQQISLDVDIDDKVIVSDQAAMEKIVYNLVSNAYKYTPAGGEIGIHACSRDEGTTISIRNSGKGIKPENIANVFDRFVILDNYEHQASKGKVIRNGIGMALVHSLVKMLSGEITVSSDPGKYTVFTVTLPKTDESCIGKDNGMVHASRMGIHGIQDVQDHQHKPSGTSGLKNGEKQTVMIVDDEKQILDLVSDILSPEYRIITACDGKDAIEKLKAGIPHLVISDLNMPNMNGVELLKHLKSDEITKFIPVIFLAFKTDIDDEIKTYELGCEGFIQKPFYPKHLIAVVHQVLQSRSMLKDYYNSAVSSTDLYEGDTVDAGDKKFLMQLTGLIEENITDEEVSPSWLCSRMSMSKMQFYRKLKELTQQTPSEFIRTVKLNRAAHLLKTTTLTVQEIMYSSGFNNKSYFYREFAEKYHMSPKEFRKEKN